jgi:mannose/fructose/N-acetylgalactosamine-specific phosphotransferase system component IID
MKILRNVLFFVLCFLAGFFAGIMVATLVDAGKGQMLAGGAIVLGYGVVGAVLGLVVALYLSLIYRAKPKDIILWNKLLAVLVLCFWIVFYVRYQQREAERKEQMGCGNVTPLTPCAYRKIRT